ncbi:MAG: SCO family protein [Chitinophagales bacterium]
MAKGSFFRYSTIALGMVVLVAIFFVYKYSQPEHKAMLPYYGPEGTNGEPHYVSPFSLLDQDSTTITKNAYKDKIFVADFFFTTCQGICPLMSEQMLRVYHTFENNNDVMFLSHTVDPGHDRPYVLKGYAERRGVDARHWHFVTGDKKEIYDLARYSYMVDASEGDGGPTDFVHTDNFALVDREGRIRGYYDGTDSVDVNKLIGDINILLQE